MTTTWSRARLLAAGALAVSLGACAAQPTTFYTLSADTAIKSAPRAEQGLTIGLGPITLPAYLDRPDIVTRDGPNQMQLAEFHRWAEPLEPLLARIMAQDLYALLDAEDVIPVPQRRDLPLDRVVEVEINRLDADQAGQVVLDARWWVFQGTDDTLLASGRSMIVEQGAAPPDYAAVVAAMSRAVAGASRDIAAAIRGGAPVPAPREARAGAAPAPSVAPRPGG